MTSEYMNNLYRDLLSNSPQTVTIPIPSDMGTGQIAQVVTKQGAVVSDWKMNYFSDMNVRGINSEDYIQMLFCLNDGVSWNIAGSREGACLAKGESCIYRGHGKMESLCYAQNSDFYFKNIKIPVPYFKRLLQDYFEDGEITVYEKKLLTGISKVSITPYMEHIFAELQDFTHYRGGLGYLFLESKIHELLSVYLSEVLELRILSPEYCCISKSERDCIIEAKRIIDSELAFAPSCEGLARQVQISVSKLSRGFSMMYGISVHAYVIEQRLERAAGLLLESNMNIGQIAVLVSHGTAAVLRLEDGKRNEQSPDMVQRGRYGKGNRHSTVQPPGHRTGELFWCHGGIGVSRRLPGREITALGRQPEPALRSVHTRLQEPDYFR